MHPNPSFRSADTQKSLTYAAGRGFGSLCINAENGPVMAQIPFIISKDQRYVAFHLVRSNPIARLGNSDNTLLAVSGPDGYISPDWYGIEQQVPTWNYVAVHIRGALTKLPPEALEPHLRALSDHFERRLLPKPIWDLDKVSTENRAKMTKMIVPMQLEIASVEATWKLGQNKSGNAARNAVMALRDSPVGSGIDELANLMIESAD